MSEKVDSAGSLLNALGGKRGLLDSGLPAAVFVTTFSITKEVKLASLFALGLAVILGAARLIARDTVQHAVSGLVGVAICAYFANRSGNAGNYYVPGFFLQAGYATVYLLGNILKWPIFGLIISGIEGSGTAWRRDPGLVRMYKQIGWVWIAMFLFKLAVQLPLYLNDKIVALGVARVAMGLPLMAIVVVISWRILKKGPRESAV